MRTLQREKVIEFQKAKYDPSALWTGEANIAYERQIAGKHSNNEFLKYCHQLN